jgi:hypothetical protein
MFTSLLFCSCLVAFLSTGSVSTANSKVDPTAYANLLALLLTGNTELASPDDSPYQRRLPQQGKSFVKSKMSL